MKLQVVYKGGLLSYSLFRHRNRVSLQLLNVFFSFFFRQDVDALGTLNVQPTFVKVKTHVPYYNLKVTLHRTGIVFEDLGLF